MNDFFCTVAYVLGTDSSCMSEEVIRELMECVDKMGYKIEKKSKPRDPPH